MSYLCPVTLLESASSLLKNRYVQGVAAVALLGVVATKIKASRAQAKFREEVRQQKKGVVHLYAMPRLFAGVPQLGGHVTKVEAFCRIHKLPYEFHAISNAMALSPTETMPFIALNGELVGESQFCVDAIIKHFGLPADEGLTPEQTAIAVMLRRMLEWSFGKHQYRTTAVDNPHVLRAMFAKFAPILGLPSFVVGFAANGMRKNVIKSLNASGLGWLSDERYVLEAMRDAKAMSALVEDANRKGNKYLFGNKPTSIDGYLYGMIAGIDCFPAGLTNGAALDFVRADPALQGFKNRFQEEFFSDLGAISPCALGTQQFP